MCTQAKYRQCCTFIHIYTHFTICNDLCSGLFRRKGTDVRSVQINSEWRSKVTGNLPVPYGDRIIVDIRSMTEWTLMNCFPVKMLKNILQAESLLMLNFNALYKSGTKGVGKQHDPIINSATAETGLNTEQVKVRACTSNSRASNQLYRGRPAKKIRKEENSLTKIRLVASSTKYRVLKLTQP